MSPLRLGAVLLMASGLGACAEGNLRSAANYDAPAAPAVRQPLYQPYPAYASAPAIWSPSVATRDGTIVKPSDPIDQDGRPDYEHAPWAIDKLAAKAGTF